MYIRYNYFRETLQAKRNSEASLPWPPGAKKAPVCPEQPAPAVQSSTTTKRFLELLGWEHDIKIHPSILSNPWEWPVVHFAWRAATWQEAAALTCLQTTNDLQSAASFLMPCIIDQALKRNSAFGVTTTYLPGLRLLGSGKSCLRHPPPLFLEWATTFLNTWTQTNHPHLDSLQASATPSPCGILFSCNAKSPFLLSAARILFGLFVLCDLCTFFLLI